MFSILSKFNCQKKCSENKASVDSQIIEEPGCTKKNIILEI